MKMSVWEIKKNRIKTDEMRAEKQTEKCSNLIINKILMFIFGELHSECTINIV